MIQIIDLKFQKTPNSIASFLVETSEGPILIETGPHATLAQIETHLASRGYTLRDVQHIFLTHIHLDHAGAAWAFAEHGATVYVHPLGERHLVDPSRLLRSAKMIYKETMDILWGQLKPIPQKQLRTMAHGEKISIGKTDLIAWYTPGHAVHHIAWQIDKELIAGDVAGVKIGDSGMVVPPCPPPDINIEHWMDSINLIEQLELEAIYLSHFGKVSNLPKHFKELRAILLDWSNWVRPYHDRGTPTEVVTPLFLAYTKNQLIQHGISAEGLNAYDKANPTWMSLLGLLRYWEKKLAD